MHLNSEQVLSEREKNEERSKSNRIKIYLNSEIYCQPQKIYFNHQLNLSFLNWKDAGNEFKNFILTSN